MRKVILVGLLSCFIALPAMSAPQSHGHGHGDSSHVGKSMNRDAHGDAVSAETKIAKQDGGKVGPDVRGVAHDKAHGKGLDKSTHGKGH